MVYLQRLTDVTCCFYPAADRTDYENRLFKHSLEILYYQLISYSFVRWNAHVYAAVIRSLRRRYRGEEHNGPAIVARYCSLCGIGHIITLCIVNRVFQYFFSFLLLNCTASIW
jgi:hypothetical protein